MALVYSRDGAKKIGYVYEANPICGKDFCDACGDCLHCYWEDPCGGDGGDHFWVVYEDELETFLADQRAAGNDVRYVPDRREPMPSTDVS